MPIIFEELETIVIVGEGELKIYLSSGGNALGIAAGTGEGDVTYIVTTDGLGEEIEFIEDDDPDTPTYGDLPIFMGSDGTGWEIVQGDAEVIMLYKLDGFSGTSLTLAGFAESTITLTMDGNEIAPFDAYGFISDFPPTIIGYGGWETDAYVDDLLLADDSEFDIILLLETMMRFSDNASWVGRLHTTLTSSLTATSVFTVLLEASFVDNLSLTDDPELLPRMILSLADQLTLTGEVPVLMDAVVTIVSAMALSDVIKYGRDVEVLSQADFTDVVTPMVNALMTAVSTLDLTDALIPNASFMATFSDSLVVTPQASYTMAAFIELLDTANFTARFSLPGNDADLYVGYAMNLRNAGMVVYDNYPFNAADTIGGLPLATGPEGLYVLEGEDDDGVPIKAKIRTGLTDYGSSVLKKVPNSYVGYTADGSLVLKVITTDGGKKKENWYKLNPRDAAAPVENRFNIAKGLVGLYWGFEIVNIDGADFELDMIRTWPFMVQRRKSGR